MSDPDPLPDRTLAPGELYWSLFSIALNTMIQPCGSICAFAPSRSIYLRSSPLVCLADTLTLLTRFTTYTFQTRSPTTSARLVLEDRNYTVVHPSSSSSSSPLATATTTTTPLPPSSPHIFRLGIFVVGILYSLVKLSASSGIPWSQAWAYSYFASFLTWFLLHRLAARAPPTALLSVPRRPVAFPESLDRGMGYAAVFLQVASLSWVDFAAVEPDRVISRRYQFRGFRLGGHVLAIFIHAIFIAVEERGPAVRVSAHARKRVSLVVVLLVLGVLAVLHGLEYKYTLYIFFYSIGTTVAAWLLYTFPFSRELVCVVGKGDYKNVLVFDFFARIFFLSLFWYFKCYRPAGTEKPEWATFFG